MNVWQDVRYGLRTLRNSPGFAVTAVLTMGLGIGVTTAIFTCCDALLWKPVPLPHLESLIVVMEGIAGDPNQWNSATPADIDDIRRGSTSIAALTSWQGGLANLVGSGGQPERVSQSLVNANFFDVVGVQPAMGRAFQTGEDQPGRDREVILSDGLWKRRFGSDPRIIGQTVRLDDQDYTVTGVMPASFDFPIATELWTPTALTPAQRASRRNNMLQSMARLKPGRTAQQAAAEIAAIAAHLEKLYPDTNKNRTFAVWPAIKFLVDYETQQYLIMLLGSVSFVLLIACANVANLQFARATGRLREVAVRRALGAGRARIITQLLTENVLLALGGALFGIVLARWGVTMMTNAMPAEVRRYILGWNGMQIDSRALLFTIVIAVFSGIIAGLSPAWQCSRPNLTDALKEGGRSSSVGKARQRFRNVLVAAEVALAVVLLVGASLMVRGFQTVVKNGAALEPSTLLTMRLAITNNKYPEKYMAAEFYRKVLESLQALPSVRSAVAVSALPYSDHSDGRALLIEGRAVEPGNQPTGMYQVASFNYFNTLHIPLRAGRLFTAGDGADAPKVAIVSQRMVDRWWKNESPIGRRIKVGNLSANGPWYTIVGVVGDVMHSPYDRVPRRTVYLPYQQAPSFWMDIGVRTAGNPLSVAPSVIAAIRSVDPEQPITDMYTLERSIHNRAIGLNYMAALMGVFGGIALLLSAIGVYGVMAYLVSEQTHEIGIRMALGASRSFVLQMIFRRGMLTALAGLVVGLPIAYGFARLMASLVFGVSPTDVATFVGIPIALIAAVVLAIYIPACRAMRIDPIVALRYE